MLERALRLPLDLVFRGRKLKVRKHTMLERALRRPAILDFLNPIDFVRKHTMLERALRLLVALCDPELSDFPSESIQCSRGH